MNEQPLVSVLMTAYNREKYIAEAIESVLSSSYTNFELIIVDDCSKDDTVRLAENFKRKDNRIKLYVNNQNIGDYKNRNKAASLASGKYLKYLDSDDYIYPQSLSIMVDHMEKNTDAAFAFSDNDKQDNLKPYPVKYSPRDSYATHFFIKDGLFYAGPGGMIINKEIFHNEGGFNDNRYTSDMHLIMRLSLKYPIIKIQPGLIWWRIHEGQENSFERNNYDIVPVRHKMAIHFLEQSCLSETEKKKAMLMEKRRLFGNIFKIIFKRRQIKSALKIYRGAGLRYSDFLAALKSYLRRNN